MNVRFESLQIEDCKTMLPQLFDILYVNMTLIAPTGCSYENDLKIWMEYIEPRIENKEVSLLLILVADRIVGYFQYSTKDDVLWAEEIEVIPELQRTKLFYLFCKDFLTQIPAQIRFVCSYVNKDNWNSIKIHEHLGMNRIGENSRGTSWLYQGDAINMVSCIRR